MLSTKLSISILLVLACCLFNVSKRFLLRKLFDNHLVDVEHEIISFDTNCNGLPKF